MTDAECEVACERLRVALEQHALGWVTRQVAEQITYGQTSVKKVSSRPDAPKHLVLLYTIEDVVLETDEMASTLRLYMNQKRVLGLCSDLSSFECFFIPTPTRIQSKNFSTTKGGNGKPPFNEAQQ